MDIRLGPAGPGSGAAEGSTSRDHSSFSPSLQAGVPSVSLLAFTLYILQEVLIHALGFKHLLDTDRALLCTPEPISRQPPFLKAMLDHVTLLPTASPGSLPSAKKGCRSYFMVPWFQSWFQSKLPPLPYIFAFT